MTSGGVLLVAILSQSPTSATDVAPSAATTRVRLEVSAAADCTSRGDLAARVAARSQRITFDDDAAVSARVEVTSARPGNVTADLVFATGGVEQPPRRFDARSCAEAADAVALIIAVTLDPTLARKPAPGAADDQAAATKPPPPPALVEPEPEPPPAPVTPTRRELGAYLAGQTIFGPAPAVMPGLALYAMAALDRDGPWAPALFVGATHVWRDDLAASNGTASFVFDAASVDACPLRLRWSLLAARPCASATVGRLTATGIDTGAAARSHRPFGAAGVALVASFGTTIEVSLRLGLGVTLLRDSYELGTNVFHRAGAITTSASLGLGVHWP
jgi:hypothetical protein